MVGSYDYCPTGNEADLPGGTVLTQQALNNPLRQGSRVYDDNLKDYFGSTDVITEVYSGVGTQVAAQQSGDGLYSIGVRLLIDPGFGLIATVGTAAMRVLPELHHASDCRRTANRPAWSRNPGATL
jgi:hypothetical protein